MLWKPLIFIYTLNFSKHYSRKFRFSFLSLFLQFPSRFFLSPFIQLFFLSFPVSISVFSPNLLIRFFMPLFLYFPWISFSHLSSFRSHFLFLLPIFIFLLFFLFLCVSSCICVYFFFLLSFHLPFLIIFLLCLKVFIRGFAMSRGPSLHQALVLLCCWLCI
jgi:hypothetical protein